VRFNVAAGPLTSSVCQADITRSQDDRSEVYITPGYTIVVRRVRASVLLFQFSVSLIAPLLVSKPEPKLPPCCRRDGKHHCAMMAMVEGEESGTGPSLRGPGKRCPLYPRASPTAAPLEQLAALPAPIRLNAPRTAGSPAFPRVQPNARSVELLSRRVRGPPPFSA